ncbi:MAG: NAD-dependent epimerase/dehydratase family protein [Deltaproteobacteria bacterium]|nr:MAG: NAD-dependent epimerase/dehydratase family protein [Deltaproteobacteria bacterium]
MRKKNRSHKILVTGVGGFIGSHLAERLVKDQHEVIGIECFTDYYPRGMKEKNIEWLKKQPNFKFHEENLLTADFGKILKVSVSASPSRLPERQLVIFHLAAQAGVRASWGEIEIYTENNIRATQRLLEWAKDNRIKKFIYASSSSVYGDTDDLPMTEGNLPKPVSPYGVTKLAGEHLCYLYSNNYRVPVTILRYFTVYGPRQRPDMAFYKFIRAMFEDREIEIYGDGTQTRDFTYIDDIVAGTISAVDAPDGEILNIGGGTRTSVKDILDVLENILQKKAKLKYVSVQKGDVKHTAADITKARKLLKYNPQGKLEDGLSNEVNWLKSTLTR